MAPEPGPYARKLREPVEVPPWGRFFLGVMAASVVAQLMLITLSLARVLPHHRIFFQAAYLGLILHWVFGGIGCLAFLAVFWQAFRRARRLHFVILGLAAFAVLLHVFLAFAVQLLFGGPGLDPLASLGRSVWALFQPGHATAYLTLGFELLRTAGWEPFPAFGRSLRPLFLLDAAAVAALYLLLWAQLRTAPAEPT